MPHLQRLVTRLLVVLALIAPTVLVAAPTAAQNGGVKVFVIANDMENDDEREEQWQMQITARPASGCTPDEGLSDYSSPWFNAGTEVGLELSVGECSFRIDVAMRQAGLRTDCFYTAQLTWVESDGTTAVAGSTPIDDYLFTSDRPDGASRLSVIRKPGSLCAFPPETRFYINGADTVEDLPGTSADADLLALAKRAAEVAEFEIRLEPDDTGGTVPAGCNRTSSFTLHGDGQRVRHPLQTSGGSCAIRASLVDAQAPFQGVEDRAVTFSDDYRIIDLTSLIHLPHARIAIIQDVVGSQSRGSATYTISRSCGGRAVASPAAADDSVDLYEGRFTVHAPSVPAFGATAIYPAVAAGTESDTIVGCSVTVSISGVPSDCTVADGSTQTLTWSETNRFRHFDFEFDIDCGAAGEAPASVDPPPPEATTPTTAPGPAEPQDAQPAEEAEPTGGGSSAPPEGPRYDAPTG